MANPDNSEGTELPIASCLLWVVEAKSKGVKGEPPKKASGKKGFTRNEPKWEPRRSLQRNSLSH